jgi:thiol-disulfide isomerase/thioredoxin
LRLGQIAQVLIVLLFVEGLVFGLAGGIMFAVVDEPGFLVLFLWVASWLGLAGLLQGLVRMGYVLWGKPLVVKKPGRLPPKPTRPLPFVGGAVLRLAVYSALFTGLVPLLQPWVFRLKPPQLPAGQNLPVLGRIDSGWQLEMLDGRQVSFGSFQGRAVLLNIWATWCPPCVAEVPSIQGLYDSLKNEGVAVVLVTREAPETVRPFVEKKGWHVPVYIARRGMPAVLRTNAIPATFVLNCRGEVVHRHTGSADWNTDDCRGLLRRLQREE